MAKTKKSANGVTAQQIGSFPVPFTLEKLKGAILDVFLHHIRTIAWMTDVQTAWRVTGLQSPAPASLLDPDEGPAELGLTYEHIRKSDFAYAMEHLYEFAYFGKLDESAEPMIYESYYMWVSAIVSDAATGYVALEWDSYGAPICNSAQICVLVAELANARNMLEGGESFFNNFGARYAKEPVVGDESLTVRQMALLAGMEEMSIRAAANPKRANPLRTHEDSGTRIAFDVAKSWLQSKGRYVPITRYRSTSDIDLANYQFTSSAALIDALEARRDYVCTRDGEEALNERLATLGISEEKTSTHTHWDAIKHNLRNESLMRALAAILELPADLLVLRVQETLAIEQLSQIERQLREINVNQQLTVGDAT